jgi:hypothetical protein
MNLKRLFSIVHFRQAYLYVVSVCFLVLVLACSGGSSSQGSTSASGGGSSGGGSNSPTGSWSLVGSAATDRTFHTSTLLADGKVLTAGGETSISIASSELYDPATGLWTNTGSLRFARRYHTTILLSNNKILAIGGDIGGYQRSTATCEIYDPATRVWTYRDNEYGQQPKQYNLIVRRWGHTATLLPNGKVLVAGGYRDYPEGYLSSCEIYDPVSETWSNTGSLNTARDFHTATLLPNGKVLVAGGYNGSQTNTTALSSCEIYDPATGIWSIGPSMLSVRLNFDAIRLSNGNVLVAGGLQRATDPLSTIASCELYNSATGVWASTGSLSNTRWSLTLTVLQSGKVLAVGGKNGPNSTPLSSCEIYDPATGIWSIGPSMSVGRYGHSSTLLTTGKVLVVGGAYGSYGRTELYTP